MMFFQPLLRRQGSKDFEQACRATKLSYVIVKDIVQDDAFDEVVQPDPL